MSIPRPPRRAVGSLDRSRRTAILIKADTLPLTRNGASLTDQRIFGAWAEAEFMSDLKGALRETAERYGQHPDALLDRVRREAAARVAGGQYDDSLTAIAPSYATTEEKVGQALWDHGYRFALLAIPDPEFLTAIEHTVSKYASASKTARISCDALMTYVDDAMRAHAVPYTANPDRRTFRWIGDRVLHDQAVAPALRVLDDPRLEGARSDFSDALVKRRAGRASDLRDAVHEAASATESIMEVLLSVHQIEAPKARAASALFNRLASPDATPEGAVLPGHVQRLVLAAADIRNQEGGHGQGVSVVAPSPAMADAAIGAAAIAITLLATYLDP